MFQYSEPVANCDQFAQFIISQLKPESIRINHGKLRPSHYTPSYFFNFVQHQISDTQSFASSPKERFCFFFNKVFLNL